MKITDINKIDDKRLKNEIWYKKRHADGAS